MDLKDLLNRKPSDTIYDSLFLGIEGYWYCKKHKIVHTAFSKDEYLKEICPIDL